MCLRYTIIVDKDVRKMQTLTMKGEENMKNVDMKMQGKKLVIEVDTSQDFGPSKSGKTIIIASTEGNQNVNGVTVGLNVYRKR